MPDFDITITTDPGAVREAQRLRFEVFNLEMGRGLKSSYASGLDVDEFDRFCEHLIVREPAGREVIGTYRLLLGSQARRHIGFYSEKEFDLSNIKKLGGELLELGRTCARKDFRDRSLIPLMWETIGDYVRRNHVRFLFGCASLYTADPQQVSEIYALLKRDHYAPERFRVQPLPSCRFENLREDVEIAEEQGLFLKLPSLIKGYLRLGAVVCGPPALDAEFGTTDFFLLLDIGSLQGDYLRRIGVGA
ncbi:MAG TPA: GNAT family N-acyltransferase [candidate division Zixibacteria bacterium]|nr:GNAT family N-acyltransferase [candidate division Zixibacteria bacterium]